MLIYIMIETAENQLGNQEVGFDVTLHCKQTKQVLFCGLNDNKV